MCQLKKKGYEFRGAFGKERGFKKKLWKNYYYILRDKEQSKLL